MFESNASRLTANNAVVSGVAEATGYKPSCVNAIPFAADAISALATDCTAKGPLSMNTGEGLSKHAPQSKRLSAMLQPGTLAKGKGTKRGSAQQC